jgi:hypothetical protein
VQFVKRLTFRRNISLASSGWKSEPSKNHKETGGKQSKSTRPYQAFIHYFTQLILPPALCLFLVDLLFDSEDGGYVLPKRRDFSKLHGITALKTILSNYFSLQHGFGFSDGISDVSSGEVTSEGSTIGSTEKEMKQWLKLDVNSMDRSWLRSCCGLTNITVAEPERLASTIPKLATAHHPETLSSIHLPPSQSI